jgi:hypothetical protein
MAPLPPEAVAPQPPKQPEPPSVRTRQGLGVLIDRFNACVGAVAELVRAADTAAPVPAQQVTDCGKLFDEILSTRQVVIAEPYAEYFLLAARVMNRLRGHEGPAGEPRAEFSVKDFVVEYNEFALKNNELMGIPVVEPAPGETVPKESIRRSVPRRTYRDELARLGETLGTTVRDWQFDHPFETLGAGAPAPWLSRGDPERVRFWMLRLTLESQLELFGRLDCDKAGTGPEDKITCDTLRGAASALEKSAREWVEAWSLLLASLRGSGGVVSAEARKACDDHRAAIEEKLRELPGRIE